MTYAWTVYPLVALLLMSCSHERSNNQSAATSTPTKILEISPGEPAKITYFLKLVLSFPPGSQIGTQGLGGFCIDRQPLTWGDQPETLGQDDIRAAFNGVLKKAGYPVSGQADVLFEDPSQTDLVAAGVVRRARFEVCKNADVLGNFLTPLIGAKPSLTGKGAVTVEWQIFSRREGKVVYEINTKGTLPEDLQKTTFRHIIIAAFTKSVEALLADGGFYNIVTTHPSSDKKAPL